MVVDPYVELNCSQGSLLCSCLADGVDVAHLSKLNVTCESCEMSNVVSVLTDLPDKVKKLGAIF